jgi:hypothetical protein
MIWFVVGGVAALIGVFVWALCVAAGDADAHLEMMAREERLSNRPMDQP